MWMDSDTVLYVVADAQSDGDSVVRSLVGPSGTLLSGTTIDVAAPKRFVLGGAPQRGITFGNVLSDETNTPFTVAAAIEFGNGPPVGRDFEEVPILSKFDLGAGVADYIGFELYAQTGVGGEQHPCVGFIANMKFTTGVWTNYDSSNPLLPGFDPMVLISLPPGRYTVGFSYDWNRPRGSRTRWYFQGRPIASSDVTETFYGTESRPVVTTAPFQFSGDFGLTGTAAPEGGKACVFAQGIKDDAWHAAFHTEMVALGWK